MNTEICQWSIFDISWMFPSLAFYCNHETRNVMISNKKLKTGLGPNTPKSLKMRHVPKRFSLLKTLKWNYKCICWLEFQCIANSSRREFNSCTGYIQRFNAILKINLEVLFQSWKWLTPYEHCQISNCFQLYLCFSNV